MFIVISLEEKIFVPRQGLYKAPKSEHKSLKLALIPLKDELKRKKTEESVIIQQTITNASKKHLEKVTTSPINCSYPDFKSILLNDRKFNFTKKEITKKPNCQN